MGRRAADVPSHRADESPSHRARKRQENKPALSALTLRAIPDAPHKCGVLTVPCSAFHLLSSPAHSRAWPFAVARTTQVCRRDCDQPDSG